MGQILFLLLPIQQYQSTEEKINNIAMVTQIVRKQVLLKLLSDNWSSLQS